MPDTQGHPKRGSFMFHGARLPGMGVPMKVVRAFQPVHRKKHLAIAIIAVETHGTRLRVPPVHMSCNTQ